MWEDLTTWRHFPEAIGPHVPGFAHPKHLLSLEEIKKFEKLEGSIPKEQEPVPWSGHFVGWVGRADVNPGLVVRISTWIFQRLVAYSYSQKMCLVFLTVGATPLAMYLQYVVCKVCTTCIPRRFYSTRLSIWSRFGKVKLYSNVVLALLISTRSWKLPSFRSIEHHFRVVTFKIHSKHAWTHWPSDHLRSNGPRRSTNITSISRTPSSPKNPERQYLMINWQKVLWSYWTIFSSNPSVPWRVWSFFGWSLGFSCRFQSHRRIQTLFFSKLKIRTGFLSAPKPCHHLDFDFVPLLRTF